MTGSSHTALASRCRVKFCGVTRPEDARAAAAAGADAIGLNFYPPSPRAVGLQQARSVVAALPPFVTVVGLFVNAEQSAIESVLDAVRLDVLQFHGDETAQECARYARPYIKAMQMREGLDVHAAARRYASARALLLDTFQPHLHGGTGTTFDWSRVPADLGLPVILAGGLNAGNVAEAIIQARPDAVDTSGGVEVSKGIKDAVKMRDFMQGVNSVTNNSLTISEA